VGETVVGIQGDAFTLNGRPTYEGRYFQGHKIEGLLLNARMVQATFDDANPETRSRWAYPDTGAWDPERNIAEFVAALPEWRACGLLAVTLNMQGGRDPDQITAMVDATRALPSYRPMPVLFNEDDHFDFDKPANNMMRAIERYASWGYFDPGASNYRDGHQCPPVNWTINTQRKQAFAAKVREVTGV